MNDCHRFFFCLKPPAGLERKIGAYRDTLGYSGTAVQNERLHVTLGITNDYREYPQSVAGRMTTIGGMVDAEPFVLPLDRISGSGSVVALRPSTRPPALGVLQRQIDRRLARLDIRRNGWTFNPHSTLVYHEGAPFLRPVPTFEWHAAELVLIHSHVGQRRHTKLGRWPLVRRQLKLAL